MQILLVAVFMMATNWLLLTASAQFLGRTPKPARYAISAVVGGMLSVLALNTKFLLGQTFWWQLLSLGTTACIAFGCRSKSFGSGILFCLLHLSLGGLVSTQDGFLSPLLGATGICLACYVTGKQKQYIPVTIAAPHIQLSIRALRDTGNTLKDPLSGKPVLVVDADTSEKLTGLCPSQLEDPLQTIQSYPGLRLIPYRTIDSNGFLLAKQYDHVTAGRQKGSVVIGFSPRKLGNHYEALAGGTLW